MKRLLPLLLAVSCAPAIPVCSPDTCAGGCCDERGVCVAGRNRLSCGLGGNACATCTGEDVCSDGVCRTEVDAGVDAGVVDAGDEVDAGRLRIVTLRQTDEYVWPDGGVSSDVVDLSLSGAPLQYVDSAGQWRSVLPTRSGAPAATFIDVPAGPYVVTRGSDFIVSDVDALELGVRTLGRRTPVANRTVYTLEVAGVPTPRFQDVVAVAGLQSGLVADSFRTTGPFDAGLLNATGDLSAQTLTALPAEGDALTVLVRRSSTDAGLTWSTVHFSGTTAAPALALGQTATVRVTVTPQAATSQAVTLRSSELEQFVTDANPAATVTSTQLVAIGSSSVMRTAGGDVEGRTPMLVSLSNAAGRPDSSGVITVGNPFTNLDVVWEARAFATVPLTVSGRTLNRSIEAVTATSSDGAPRVTLSPVRFLRINGATATTNRTGVGVSPAIEWSAPAVGRPTSYLVLILKLTPQGTGLTDQLIARVRTPFARVKLPPGLLTEGDAFVAMIIAAETGFDARVWPLHVKRDTGRSVAITNPFVP